MNEGWIKIHRSLLNWEWHDDPLTVALWIHCLLKANYEDKKWHGKVIHRGEFITSYAHLAEETGLSIRQVRTRLEKLETTQNVTRLKTDGKHTFIRVNDYDKYQSDTKSDKQMSNRCQSNDNQMTTTKEYKEYKEEKKCVEESTHTSFIPPTEEEVIDFAERNGLVIDAKRFFDYYNSRNWKGVYDWQTYALNWDKQDKADGKEREVKGNNDYSDLPSV